MGIDRRAVLTVVALYAASHMLYWWLGMRFDASPLFGYMQFIDVGLLANRLLESLWYYHANPPLLNLFAGVRLRCSAPARPPSSVPSSTCWGS